ncbi:hypothetical protein RHS04_09075 [Rhizoctonia solani]|uniref:Uncharacterized protein n=1 Tax=Rhizoctonia solani TaxID=456999 RepID=A0A8H7GYQ8_9AGAM|nr:hypothetical protein RHS04_09075 [Rhizoctonia solani]
MSTGIPTLIQEVYRGSSLTAETVTLDPEAPRSKKSQNEVIVRALDGFVFVKHNKLVYPWYQDLTPEWWEDVQAYGYVTALVGQFKFFVWAGFMGKDYSDKHLVFMCIKDIVGMVKESSPHWRSGFEEILWLESKAGYSYALMEPDAIYDEVRWAEVIQSWTNLPPPLSQEDPTLREVDRAGPQPQWWKVRGGKSTWEWFTKSIRDAKAAQEGRKAGHAFPI